MMKTYNTDSSGLQWHSFHINDNLMKFSSPQVFMERNTRYMDELNFYITHFNIVPNVVTVTKLYSEEAHDWFLANFKAKINDSYYDIEKSNEDPLTDNYLNFYFLYEDLIVVFQSNSSSVKFLFRKTSIENVNLIIDGVKCFYHKQTKNYTPWVSVLIFGRDGLKIIPSGIKRTKLNIADNYNDDFAEVHQTILKRLKKKDDDGMVILHGKRGTGKKSYIRYLMSILKKDLIILPPNTTSVITDEELITVSLENPDAIFVIEDAENIVMGREQLGGSPISALFHISDWLMADLVNIQIICSFNTDISKVESALLAKEKLIAKYEFKELALTKTRKLSKKLGFETVLNEPMNLGAIYTQNKKDF